MGETLAFDDYEMHKFIKDWYKYKNLLHSNSIDKDIYKACIEKMLREANKEIGKATITNTGFH